MLIEYILGFVLLMKQNKTFKDISLGSAEYMRGLFLFNYIVTP